MRAIISLLFISLLSVPAALSAAPTPASIVNATIYSEKPSFEADTPFRLGVLLEPVAGWHTYWENPGDAGLATKLVWTLPEGFTAGTIDWPMPRRMAEGPLVVYGYEGTVFLPVTITPPAALNPGPYTFRVKASWLVCKDICIPEAVELEITLPDALAGASNAAKLFSNHDALKPSMVALPATYADDGTHLTVSVPLSLINTQDTPVTAAQLFLREHSVVRYAAEQQVSVEDGVLRIVVERSSSTPLETLHGLLSVTAGGKQKYFDLVLQSAESANQSADKAPTTASLWFPVILLLALLGGMILNLMPCVLPVLSLKALAVVKQANGERLHVRQQGLAYTLGILVSFAAIAAVLLALKAGGEAVGWGYQMQSPAFVGFLIYLLFLVGLSLSGFFYLPVVFGNLGASMMEASSVKGSFLTGMLATAVATPCTAPFMASAVGAALTLPSWQALLVFETLGLGLALPFLLISLYPKLLRFLPKPGAWMETFKQFLAFPMYASVIWLLWVLAQQTGPGGVAVALIGMLVIVIAIWMKRLFANPATYRLAALAALAGIIVLSLMCLSKQEMPESMPASAAEHGVETVAFSPTALGSLRMEGKPVFVDVTAAWCITCQVNKRVAIQTDRVMQAFKERGVTLMVADWTRRNKDITEFLANFGYQGVPLYVFYPAGGGEAKVLPQLLTPDIVIDAITAN